MYPYQESVSKIVKSIYIVILHKIEDIFLPSCPQVLSPLNIGFKNIFELHKSLVHRGKSFYR